MPQGRILGKQATEIGIHLGHGAGTEEEVLLTALLAGQRRRRFLAARGRLIEGQGDGGFGNGPGLELLAGHVFGPGQHQIGMVGQVVEQQAAQHHHGAHPSNRMEGLGQLAEVEGLRGLIQQPLARRNLLALLWGIEPTRIRQALADRPVNQVMGLGGGGQEIVDGLAGAGARHLTQYQRLAGRG